LTELKCYIGVPVSTQWEANGYYYPVQVAQYGLSHYSKNLTEPPPKRRLLEDGDTVNAKWQVPKGAYVKRVFDEAVQSNVAEFNSRGTCAFYLFIFCYLENQTVDGK
jgi:heparosan-N-sulfate-glucuronate 5-epimerase